MESAVPASLVARSSSLDWSSSCSALSQHRTWAASRHCGTDGDLCNVHRASVGDESIEAIGLPLHASPFILPRRPLRLGESFLTGRAVDPRARRPCVVGTGGKSAGEYE